MNRRNPFIRRGFDKPDFFGLLRGQKNDFRKAINNDLWLTPLVFALTYVVWALLSKYFFSDFNPLSYWMIQDDFVNNIFYIAWPACLYAIAITQTAWFYERTMFASPSFADLKFSTKGVMALFAGVFEELEYRAFYIYFGLIAVYIANEFFFWFILLLFVIVYLAVVFKLKTKTVFNVILLIVFYFIWDWVNSITGSNPIHYLNEVFYNIYLWLVSDKIVLTIIIFTTAILLKGLSVLLKKDEYNFSKFYLLISGVIFTVWAVYALPLGINALKDLPFLSADTDHFTYIFYIGAILWANSSFKDGHKYLGIYGQVHSSIFGFYMFYVAFTYGLVYAIVIHFLYDLILLWGAHIISYIKERRQFSYEFE